MKKVEVIKGEGLLNGRRNGAEIKLKRVAAYCRVSTDSEDQLQSYHSQVKYYTDLINENPDWTMAGIYADEAITGKTFVCVTIDYISNQTKICYIA